jgi:hypothetical protein
MTMPYDVACVCVCVWLGEQIPGEKRLADRRGKPPIQENDKALLRRALDEVMI